MTASPVGDGAFGDTYDIQTGGTLDTLSKMFLNFPGKGVRSLSRIWKDLNKNGTRETGGFFLLSIADAGLALPSVHSPTLQWG